MKLAKWYLNVEESGFKSFNSIVNTIYSNHQNILNFFDNRSTNTSTESFNAKLKAYRVTQRGEVIYPFLCTESLKFMDNNIKPPYYSNWPSYN